MTVHLNVNIAFNGKRRILQLNVIQMTVHLNVSISFNRKRILQLNVCN